jgi:ectoine hydroxylase-related dioxygenase (phytanoyl-CoA dioxygenase family)
MTSAATLSPNDLSDFDRDGFLVVRGLFARDEIAELAERFRRISDGPANPPYWEPEVGSPEPLRRYPRIVHPHRIDDLCRQLLLDRRVLAILRELLRDEPVAVQSMFYFKPPGARGQAFHQDDLYLQTRPDPCIAAWTAVDPSLPENGGLFVVPGTHRMDVQCPELADEAESFTTHFTRPPTGREPVAAKLDPGDTLFFTGSVIHGSRPNRTKDQWRRSFICHYIPRHSTHIARWFQPALDFNGGVVEFGISADGGPCGTEFFTPFWEGLSDEEKRKHATAF